MAAQALYRKWRSQTFDELIGQEPIMQTLRNALRDGRVAHAYLFTGPRGTGKTSTARILAKAVNCEAAPAERPCNQCRMCRAINEDRLLDLIEIDAASHTGVDNMRETVIDRVNFRPGEARYKIYIIDEVHMLSTSSFNALLKTLEEPPAHVIFILATTDVQKVPATVISRCQRFDFRRIPQREMVRHLQAICQAEERQAELEALNAIARYATGCMRDAISLLDQLMAYGGETITAQQVESMLGTVPSAAIARLVNALAAHDPAAGLGVIGDLSTTGVELRELARQTVDYLRALLLIQMGGNDTLIDLPAEMLRDMAQQARRFEPASLLRAIRLFNQAAVDLRGNLQGVPQLALELAVVEAALDGADKPLAANISEQAASAATPVRAIPASAAAPVLTRTAGESQVVEAAGRPIVIERPAATTSMPPTSVGPTPSPSASDAQASEVDKLGLLRQNWARVKELLQDRRRMLLGILTGGVRFLAIEQSEVIIGYDGSKKEAQYNARRLLEPENKATLESVLSDVLGGSYRITVLAEDQYQARPRPAPVTVQPPTPAPQPPGSSQPMEDPVVAYARELGAVVRELSTD
ncbi:DNA polymerase III subunit gamma/tau [Candidatus Amarolinea aalborgensis]|uniref:DNA polymerase III subunit gamma/tau n=1 Tax=Candidatus Amarolinea aalborgensis TaxID=2249329 RepID=UPI003BF9F558